MSTAAASAVPARALANGVEMPVLGYGVFQTPPEETERCVREVLEVEDRKSTRLNSSHARISYAVFCLKKKK